MKEVRELTRRMPAECPPRQRRTLSRWLGGMEKEPMGRDEIGEVRRQILRAFWPM